MVVISFHCDPDLKQALEDRAKKLGWKRNFLIRECLRHYYLKPQCVLMGEIG